MGFVGGIAGTDSGLAAIVTLGFVGGIAGTDSGLAAIVTLGFVGGIAGTDSGLASAQEATVAIAATKTKPRTDLEVISLYSCALKYCAYKE